MQILKYLLLLSVCCLSSAFANTGDIFLRTPFTCPQNFPSFAPVSSRIIDNNYFSYYGNFYQPQPNVMAYQFIAVNAENLSQGKTKALAISSSGLTAYSSQPSQIPYSTLYYCAYHSSEYPLPNESPDQAQNSQADAAYVMLWSISNH